jgi:glycosyltransferase involved in cell wall biosynthesis
LAVHLNGPREKIGLAPRLVGLGGMVSFQAKLINGLEKRGIQYTFNLEDAGLAAILVIGGTREIPALLRARQHGVRIVQRLNGMNWMHRKKRTGWKAFLRAEGNNTLLAAIRRFIAHQIVYQSQFSQTWWERIYGKLNYPPQVIYNGVDLDTYTNLGSHQRPTDHYRLLLVEGHLDQSNRQGFDHAVQLAQALRTERHLAIELCVVGDVAGTVKAANPPAQSPAETDGWEDIIWKGVLAREQIPEMDRSAHGLFSADLNAACPNSVIEAMACGLPVIAFDTGALSELVQGNSGRVAPYGSNHWNLEPPVLAPLVDAAQAVLEDNAAFRQAARSRAVAEFGLDKMVESYLKVLLG